MYRLMSDAKPEKADLPPGKSLTEQAAGGFTWMIAQTLGSKFFGFATQIALARLLVPRDFGLVALAYTAVAFVAVIRNTGIQQILVQRQKHFRRWANPAFWMEFAVGLATAAMLAIAAPISAIVFHNGNLAGLILIVAAAGTLSAWNVVPSAKLMIDMRFRAVAAVNISYTVISSALSVLLAWRGFGAYSFVIPLPVACIVRAIWLWRLTRPPVRWRPQFRRWRFLVGDSFYMLAASFFLTVMFQAGSLALGLFCTKAVVGQFFFALNLSTQIAQLLSQNLGNVLLPALAKLQQDQPRQVAAILRASRLLAIISIPLSLLLAVAAKPGIAIIFGSKWLPAAPVLQLLAIGMAINIPSTPAYTALQSRGLFKTIFVYIAVQFLPFMLAVLFGARYGGAVGAAAAWGAAQFILSPIWIRLGCGRSNQRWVVSVFILPLVSAGLALAPALVLFPFVKPSAFQYWIQCGIAVASLAIFYPLLAGRICRGDFIDLKSQIARLLARLSRRT
jgi:O-antigen/teichoic acid export membrane protein